MEIEVTVTIEEINKIRTGREKWKDMVLVKLKSDDEKRKIMEEKKKLKKKPEYGSIMDDLT